MDTEPRPDRTDWIVALLCLLPYLGFWLYGLTDLDEGFYGAVVTDMVRRGDWITPTYNGVPWFEKPILSYWLAIPLVSLFPSSELAARLPSFICTLATAFVLYRFALRHFDRPTARLTALVYTSSLLVVAIGRMMMTDSALVLALTLAFTLYYDSLALQKPNLKLGTAALLGVAVLAKGPVALVLFGLLAAFAYWRLPDLRPAIRGPWLAGTAILFAVVATWYVPAYLANPDTFLQKFLIEQNIGRFQGGDVAHTVAWYLNGPYFPLVVALALAPWLASAFKAKWHDLKIGTGNPRNLRVYLWIWALVVIVFFTLSKTKLPHYVLPAIPPLALLAAEAIAHRHPARKPEKFWLTLAAAFSVAVCLLANAAFLAYHRQQFAEPQALAKHAWQQNTPLIVVSKPSDDKKPEIKLTLDRTSNPSILFYYRSPAPKINDLTDLPPDILNSDQPVYFLVDTDDPRFQPEILPTAEFISSTNLGLADPPDRQRLVKITPYSLLQAQKY